MPSLATGIVFALVLVAVPLGFFVGLTRTTSNIIEHSGVDLWVCPKGIPYFDVGSILRERKVYQILEVPGVLSAEKLIVRFTTWKRPDGGGETIEIVRFNPAARAEAPRRDVEIGDIPFRRSRPGPALTNGLPLPAFQGLSVPTRSSSTACRLRHVSARFFPC